MDVLHAREIAAIVKIGNLKRKISRFPLGVIVLVGNLKGFLLIITRN